VVSAEVVATVVEVAVPATIGRASAVAEIK
jgi:hypothetical protein